MTDTERTFCLGTTDEGHHVFAHVRVEHYRRPFTLTNHETVEGIDEVGISWTVTDGLAGNEKAGWKYAHDPLLMRTDYFDRRTIGGGQVPADKRVITRPAMSREHIELIEQAWEHHHLNTLKAGCEHIVDGDIGDVCPVTGYRWGSAWLATIVPEEVLTGLRNLIAHPVTHA